MDANCNNPVPMLEEEFARHLSGLVGAALTGGVSFGAIVHNLEFAKFDVMTLAQAQTQETAEAAKPMIITVGKPT